MQVPLGAARLLARRVVRPVLGTRLSPARQRPGPRCSTCTAARTWWARR
ncbi:hypothetical protein [Nocardioides humi]|nr:hypothetical protein [Nocardioides humi]